MTFVLGLTGSIGMGKSTTAKIFADEGVPVWDADATVRDLYAEGGAAAALIAKYYPTAMDGGAVSRGKLRDLISADPTVLDKVQRLVHPLVAQSRAVFVAEATAPIIVLDIPLLFETKADGICDGIAVVSVPFAVQRARVLERGEMTEEDFALIVSRQMPDAEKRAKARWVIPTLSLDAARQSVKDILAEISKDMTVA